MNSSIPPAGGLRGITRGAVRTRLSEVAIDLFSEYGFDEVTVEQIAAAAGISARSFHRYFRSKEDAVIGDLESLGVKVRDTFSSRPRQEPVWESLRVSLELLLTELGVSDERGKRTMLVISSTASLRARNLEKHLLWARLLTPLVADRLSGGRNTLQAETIVQTGLVCLDVALTAWAKDDEATDSAELLRAAFATLRPSLPSASTD
jgi:AcrR family transcriptional regulator